MSAVTILGIETSCDETAAAVVTLSRGKMTVRHEAVASQAKLHAKYGGVVPEVAARKQVEAIIPILREVRVRPADIDAIAVTAGPGLVTSLSVGVETAKVLSLAWRKPLLPINHVLAHLYATWLSHPQLVRREASYRPAVGFVISGGHTELVLLKGHGAYALLGRTLDDAAGECLDKSARLLGLPYPGGAALERLARRGRPDAVSFPQPLAHSRELSFSFSGLKTAVRYELERHPAATPRRRADVAASIQAAVVNHLCRRLDGALAQTRAKAVLIGGGVTANETVRLGLAAVAGRHGVPLLLPNRPWTGDNAAMVAAAGLYRWRSLTAAARRRALGTWKSLSAEPNWEL